LSLKIGPSTFVFCKFFFFLIFCIFLKTSNINVDSMRKINDFKNDVWQVERVRNFFENLNSFLDDVENAKNDTNILKKHFLYFCWFCYFWIFRGDHPHTHAYPGLFSWATCPHILKVVYFQGRPAHTLTLTLVYFHGRPAHTYSKWSISTGDLLTHSH